MNFRNNILIFIGGVAAAAWSQKYQPLNQVQILLADIAQDPVTAKGGKFLE
jgi:hypothetical protein